MPPASALPSRPPWTAPWRPPRGANPLVGAVVIGTDGTPVVTGYHRGAGTAHAEADAIAQAAAAGLDLTGTTMVVTLEPCNHCGRTGPCAQAIIDAGITDVIYAVDDPHDPAAGGAVTLRAAGVRVRSGLAADAALDLNRRWFDAVAAKRPFVTLHVAQTLDSRIAASDGTSQWISSPESLADNHALRGRIDAILVGTQTVLIDNPRLTARNAGGEAEGKQPLRAVMGYRGIPDDAAIHGADGNVLHLATRDPRAALDDLGITTLADAQRWEWDPASGGAVQVLGRDLRLHLRPAATPTSSDTTPHRTGADTA